MAELAEWHERHRVLSVAKQLIRDDPTLATVDPLDVMASARRRYREMYRDEMPSRSDGYFISVWERGVSPEGPLDRAYAVAMANPMPDLPPAATAAVRKLGPDHLFVRVLRLAGQLRQETPPKGYKPGHFKLAQEAASGVLEPGRPLNSAQRDISRAMQFWQKPGRGQVIRQIRKSSVGNATIWLWVPYQEVPA